jgi:hypothetical protein
MYCAQTASSQARQAASVARRELLNRAREPWHCWRRGLQRRWCWRAGAGDWERGVFLWLKPWTVGYKPLAYHINQFGLGFTQKPLKPDHVLPSFNPSCPLILAWQQRHRGSVIRGGLENIGLV